jgi:hypothetical protein
MKTNPMSRLACLALAWAVPASLGAQVRERLEVRINNAARFDGRLLDEAERVVHAILWGAGVRVETTFCPESEPARSACTEGPFGPAEVLVNLLPCEATPLGGREDSLGVTLLGEGASRSTVYVFRPAIERLLAGDARGQSLRAVVVGHAIAHELGHLLLASPEHAISGIMSTRWGTQAVTLAAMGGLHFSKEQSRRLQEAIRERTPDASARPAVIGAPLRARP